MVRSANAPGQRRTLLAQGRFRLLEGTVRLGIL
jgi:hypothetical protein